MTRRSFLSRSKVILRILVYTASQESLIISNIENLALDVPSIVTVLEQLPPTFLAQLKTIQGEDFAIVSKKKNNIVVHFSVDNKKTYSQEEFLNEFTGILIAVEKDTIAHIQQKTNTSLWREGLLGMLGVTVIGLISLNKPQIDVAFYTLLSIVSIFASMAIIKQQLGISSSLGNAFCSGENTTKDCNAVISSSGSKIFGLKLSDSSIVFFTGLLISSILSILLSIEVTPLLFVSLAVSPIVLYSIYYQYVFAKAWCPLCLVIAGILIVQAIIATTGIISLQKISFPLETMAVVIVSFLSVLAGWLYLNPFIQALKELKQQKIDYFKFKRNYSLFSTLLEKSPIKNTAIYNTSEIVFGNPNANLSIIIVTSPVCGHCKPVHKHVEKILNTYNDLVKITIRFSVITEDATKPLLQITSRLTEIFQTQGEEACKAAMHDIYAGMAVERWLATWGSCAKPMIYNQVLNSQSNWCKDESINFTPAILINGRSYPSEYAREDLIYFIEELHENCSISDPIVIDTGIPTTL